MWSKASVERESGVSSTAIYGGAKNKVMLSLMYKGGVKNWVKRNEQDMSIKLNIIFEQNKQNLQMALSIYGGTAKEKP